MKFYLITYKYWYDKSYRNTIIPAVTIDQAKRKLSWIDDFESVEELEPYEAVSTYVRKGLSQLEASTIVDMIVESEDC